MEEIGVYSIPGFREPVSCFTHLLAVPVFAVLGFFLVRRGRGSWLRTTSLLVMVLSTVFLLSMSSVYHMLSPGLGRRVMRQLDIAGVFVLIAGTVTPIHAILFKGFYCWGPLIFVWAAAATGITLMSMFSESLGPGIRAGVFVLLGWGGLVSCIVLWRRYGFPFVAPLLWGGVAYTVGAAILSFPRMTLLPGIITAHELWHVAVLMGLGFHWEFVFRFAAGLPKSEIEK